MKLSFKFDSGQTVAHEVLERSFTIGRSEKCRLAIDSEGFSREHALIELINGIVYVTDLASKNGVYINHIRLPKKMKVAYDLKLPLFIGDCFVTLDITKDLCDPDYLVLETHENVAPNEVYHNSENSPKRRVPKPRPVIPPAKVQKLAVVGKSALVILFVLVVLLAFSVGVFAEEEQTPFPADFDFRQDSISEKYLAGAFLVYDCEEKHWVCVLKEDFAACGERRGKSIEAREKQLPCAPIGEFPTKRSCFQRQLYLSGQAHGHRFCLLEELKKEELE